jgi:hypothetical protein
MTAQQDAFDLKLPALLSFPDQLTVNSESHLGRHGD